MTIDIDNKLHNDIKEYCKLNGLVMKDFVNKLLKKSFAVEKYGETPFGNAQFNITFHKPPKKETPEIINMGVEEITTAAETVGNGEISEKYKKTNTPKEFYGEIEVEPQETKRSKKRKL